MRGRRCSRTALGSMLMTGDYKFDQTPVDGRPADVSRLAEIGSKGSSCLFGDSTNADRPGVASVGVERRPGAAASSSARCEGRIIVTSVRVQHPPRPAGDRRRCARSTARSRWSAARCARTSTSPRNLRVARGADGHLHPAARRSRTSPTTRSCVDLDRQPGRSRSRRCAGWATQRPPRRASFTPATR